MEYRKVDGSSDLIIFTPKIFKDERGYFLEKFNHKNFNAVTGQKLDLFQQNESFSSRGTLRGLHYQLSNTQAKLVSVIKGKIFDVALDMRRESKTFGKHFSIQLDEEKKEILWIPKGYAHGFLVLSDNAIFSYLVDNPYDPQSERTIFWSDPYLEIDWGYDDPVVSTKDSNGILFKDATYL